MTPPLTPEALVARMKRDPQRWARTVATAIPSCSPAHIQYLVADAQADIALLLAALQQAATERDGWRDRAVRAEAALAAATAERDAYALVLSDCAAALEQVPLGQLPGCVDMMVVSALAAPLANGERSAVIAAADRIEATVTAEVDSLRAEVEAKDKALRQVKTWIDTDLPAGTSRAGTIHRVITKALDRTALARPATAREGA